jgi:hypothetical protein
LIQTKIPNKTSISKKVTKYQKALNKVTNEATDILNAKNNPSELTGIFQKEAKTQKASMMDEIKAKDNVKTDYSDVAKQKTGGEINERLQNKLDAWKKYKAGGGDMDMKRWTQATQKHYGNPNRFGDGYGKWINKQEKGIHGNSLDATGPHDLYVIRQKGTDQILHFGETGRGYQIRGDEWSKHLKNEYGLETYVDLLKTVEGKRAAKVLETKYIKTYEKIFGHKPGFTDANGAFNQIQKTEH